MSDEEIAKIVTLKRSIDALENAFSTMEARFAGRSLTPKGQERYFGTDGKLTSADFVKDGLLRLSDDLPEAVFDGRGGLVDTTKKMAALNPGCLVTFRAVWRKHFTHARKELEKRTLGKKKRRKWGRVSSRNRK